MTFVYFCLSRLHLCDFSILRVLFSEQNSRMAFAKIGAQSSRPRKAEFDCEVCGGSISSRVAFLSPSPLTVTCFVLVEA